jgi:hypothetical protein
MKALCSTQAAAQCSARKHPEGELRASMPENREMAGPLLLGGFIFPAKPGNNIIVRFRHSSTLLRVAGHLGF